MAGHDITKPRSLQPKGPSYIRGPSFGGDIAFEMAYQLGEMRQPVGFIALLDTYGPEYPHIFTKHHRCPYVRL